MVDGSPFFADASLVGTRAGRDIRLYRDAMMRAPRRGELQLLALLRGGPMAVTTGPVGRCVKRGWCSVDIAPASGAAVVRYSLTDAGRALLDAAPEGAMLDRRRREAKAMPWLVCS